MTHRIRTVATDVFAIAALAILSSVTAAQDTAT